MATVTTKGAGKALMIIDAGTKAPINLPLAAQEKIMTPIVNLKEWIRARMRTGGIGKMLPGGKIKYYAFPKQTTARDIEITYDDSTGNINGGMFGAESGGLIDGIKSTYGINLVYDEVTLKAAKFLKHTFMNSDIAEEGLESLTAAKLADFTNETAEDALVALKTSYVAAMGTRGKWAIDKGYTLPTTGTGKRVENVTYTVDAAGGKLVKDKIIDKLIYRDKIGLKDGVEPTYPFARGLDSSKSCLIEISGDINKAILKAVEESQNGFLTGVGVNASTGVVTSISYNGKTVPVEVVDDMPQKNSKDFNWNICEIGKHGAIAMPNKWNAASLIRPDYEGLSLIGKKLEAVGLLAGLKVLQPELMFSSFKQ